MRSIYINSPSGVAVINGLMFIIGLTVFEGAIQNGLTALGSAHQHGMEISTNMMTTFLSQSAYFRWPFSVTLPKVNGTQT